MADYPTASNDESTAESQQTLATVVSLAAYRKAVESARWLATTGNLERVSWVQSVHAEVLATGEAVIVIVVEPPVTVMRGRCLPTGCNDIPVYLREGR
jgi:hypothetical protein